MADPVVVDQFGGLNLADDPSEIGFQGAIDLLNVDFKRPGRVRTRDGLAQFASIASASSPTAERVFPFVKASGAAADLLLVLHASTNLPGPTLQMNLSTVTTTGTVTPIGFWLGSTFRPTVTSVALYGTPTNRYALVASRDGNTGLPLVDFDGTTVAAGTSGSPKYVATWHERIVVANFAAAADSPSGVDGTNKTVFFADPGIGGVYGVNNFVPLQPNVGEIIEMRTWGNDLYVFDYRTVYQFYGERLDSGGNPVFDYREISLPTKMRTFRFNTTVGLGVVCEGEDGMYVLCEDGIWRTSGGPPVRISDPVRPIFDGTADEAVRLVDDVAVLPHMTWVDGQLVLNYVNEAQEHRTLVWEPRRNTWTLWAFPAAGNPADLCEWLGSLYVLLQDATDNVELFKLTMEATADDGAAIPSRYQTGFASLANGLHAGARGFDVEGSGQLRHSIAVDHGSLDTGSPLVLGSSPTVARTWDNVARSGRNFSFGVHAETGAWSLNRWTAKVQSVRSW